MTEQSKTVNPGKLWLSDKAAQALKTDVKPKSAVLLKREAEEKAQADAKRAKEEEQAKVRAALKAARDRAEKSDRRLHDAVAALEHVDRSKSAVKTQAAPAIAKAKEALASTKARLELIGKQFDEARAAYERAQSEMESTSTFYDLTAAANACEVAIVEGKAAAKEADEAWHDVSTAWRKEHRDRKLRRRARELGLTEGPEED